MHMDNIIKRNDMSITFLQQILSGTFSKKKIYKWQIVTSCYYWGKKVILVLVSNLN